jgi:GR25 family glycosyltransferase involved in LPS biosynthesis
MKIINILIIFFLLILYIVYFRMIYSNMELFDIVNQIDFYVITMGIDQSRLQNIKSQIEKQIDIMDNNDKINNKNNKFTFSIQKVDAVVGKNLNVQELIDQHIITDKIFEGAEDNPNKVEPFGANIKIRKNELGCYLSHLKTYDIIKSKNKKDGYSVIFEDDFELTSDFIYTLEKTMTTLKDIDFDFLFLGLLGYNGKNIIDNVYEALPGSFQTHGYLIKNSNIDKIIEKLKFVDDIIDVQIFKKGGEKELNVLRIDPTIVNQSGFGSEIRF